MTHNDHIHAHKTTDVCDVCLILVRAHPEYRAMIDNLTSVQARSTELIQAERAATRGLRDMQERLSNANAWIVSLRTMLSRVSGLDPSGPLIARFDRQEVANLLADTDRP